eukprot:9451754-Pyramimonas_sp.AAC.1
MMLCGEADDRCKFLALHVPPRQWKPRLARSPFGAAQTPVVDVMDAISRICTRTGEAPTGLRRWTICELPDPDRDKKLLQMHIDGA